MSLIDNIIARAKSNRQRIVLPESLEERTITAADKALADEIADIILIGDRSEILALADRLGLKNIGKATIIDPKTSEKTEEYAQLLFQLRQKKGMTIEKAHELVMDPLYFGCLIIKSGDADGQISGALSTTGETLRPDPTTVTEAGITLTVEYEGKLYTKTFAGKEFKENSNKPIYIFIYNEKISLFPRSCGCTHSKPDGLRPDQHPDLLRPRSRLRHNHHRDVQGRQLG